MEWHYTAAEIHYLNGRKMTLVVGAPLSPNKQTNTLPYLIEYRNRKGH